MCSLFIKTIQPDPFDEITNNRKINMKLTTGKKKSYNSYKYMSKSTDKSVKT